VEFSNFVLSEMKDGLQVDAIYTDFSMIFWMGSYLTIRTQRVRIGDYLSETIYCHSGVPQSSHLGPLFFKADINEVLGIFENDRVLAYADDLKLYMRVKSTDECHLFRQDLDRLQGWCREKK
jgi:hypothetical protein